MQFPGVFWVSVVVTSLVMMREGVSVAQGLVADQPGGNGAGIAEGVGVVDELLVLVGVPQFVPNAHSGEALVVSSITGAEKTTHVRMSLAMHLRSRSKWSLQGYNDS